MDKPIILQMNDDGEFVDTNLVNQQSSSIGLAPARVDVKLISNEIASNEKTDVKQPAKITMNIPFLMPKVTSPIKAQCPEKDKKDESANLSTIPFSDGQKNIIIQSGGGITKQMSTFGNVVPTPIRMQLDPGVLECFKSGTTSPTFDRPPPRQVVDPSDMINRIISQPSSTFLPVHGVKEFTVSQNRGLRQTFPQTQTNCKSTVTPIMTAMPRPSFSVTICKSSSSPGLPSTIAEIQEPLKLEQISSATKLTMPVHTFPAEVSVLNTSVMVTPQNTVVVNKLPITSASPEPSPMPSNQSLNVTVANTPITQNTQLVTVPNNNVNQNWSNNGQSLHVKPIAITSFVVPPTPMQPPVTGKKIPVDIDRETSPDKIVGKMRGPKCYRQSEIRPEVSLGPYQRPKVPVKLRSKDIKREDIAMLVMPSEDWSCTVYDAPNQRHGKCIYVISETLLNSDFVEIVRKSISLLPNWGMKFSVMAADASRFNLGLDASDITDIQSVLDNFDEFPVCSGVRDATILKGSTLSPFPESKVVLYSDKRYRSIECPLLLVKYSDKKCSPCLKLLQMLS